MEKKISYLENSIKIYSWIGWIFVIFAIAPIIYAVIIVISQNGSWKEEDLGAFLGGVSGTFASLAGVFFVFVAFLGQRISIIQQQIELQDNRKELQETRKEIQGQKEQLILQNKQFQIQSFESTFFRLLDFYKSILAKTFEKTPATLENRAKLFAENLKILESQRFIKGVSRDELIRYKKSVFDDDFSYFKLQNEAIIRSIYGICIHIQLNKSLEIKEKQFYFDILYRQLSIPEINFIFYGFFSDEGLYNPFFEQILAVFLRNIEEKRLFIPSDKFLLEEIELPDYESYEYEKTNPLKDI
jgi:hypothetical protein